MVIKVQVILNLEEGVDHREEEEEEEAFNLLPFKNMNRNGHVIWSEFILILSMGGFLIYLLNDYGLQSVSIAIILSIGTYLLGCVAPDFDHPKVHKSKWIAKYSKHRGHFHSLIAMLIYGVILFLASYWLIHYWWTIVITGMFGFFTHLLLDELKNLKTNGSRALKLW